MPEFTDREKRFLDRLWEIQKELDLSNGAFAEMLGIDRTVIPHTLSRKTLGKALLVAACDRFEELRSLYFAPSVPLSSDDRADKTRAVA